MQDLVKETFNAVIESVGHELKKSGTTRHIEISISHDGSWGVNVFKKFGAIACIPERYTPYDQLQEALKYIKEA